MGRMVSHEMQKVLRNCSMSPGSWNVISSTNAVLQVSALEVLAEQLGCQCSSDNLSEQGRCCVSDLAYLVPVGAFDHPIIWEGLQPQ